MERLASGREFFDDEETVTVHIHEDQLFATRAKMRARFYRKRTRYDLWHSAVMIRKVIYKLLLFFFYLRQLNYAAMFSLTRQCSARNTTHKRAWQYKLHYSRSNVAIVKRK